MDTPCRTLVKALTWQGLGLFAMTLTTYAVTGSLSQGGTVAVIGAIAGLVTYTIHERVWARIGWGRRITETGRSAPAMQD